MKHAWHVLLALRRSAGSRLSALTDAIVQTAGQAEGAQPDVPRPAEPGAPDAVDRLGEPDLESLCRAATWAPRQEHWRAAAREVAAIAGLDIELIPFWRLPPRLRRTRPVPLALFVRGDAALLSAPRACGIVGSRAAHDSAVHWTHRQARAAAENGELVVSGGARGIDAAAHRAALEGRAPTLAYLGVAVDRSYPSEHRRLFARIIENGGAIVSEHPPTSPTLAYDHAKRNRFIAAHAENLLIAEAAARSGTLGTARYAHRYGTPVWVSPPGVGRQRDGLEELVSASRARVLEGLLPRRPS